MVMYHHGDLCGIGRHGVASCVASYGLKRGRVFQPWKAATRIAFGIMRYSQGNDPWDMKRLCPHYNQRVSKRTYYHHKRAYYYSSMKLWQRDTVPP